MTSPGAEHRAVGFQEALQLFIRNALTFEGRSSRGAYWWPALAVLIIGMVLNQVDSVLLFGLPLFGGLFSLLCLLPGIAVTVRRLHDVGKSGWWTLVALIPVAGAAVLIYLAAQPGVRAANEFGPDVEAGRGADLPAAA